jgi:hypothetical protein
MNTKNSPAKLTVAYAALVKIAYAGPTDSPRPLVDYIKDIAKAALDVIDPENKIKK